MERTVFYETHFGLTGNTERFKRYRSNYETHVVERASLKTTRGYGDGGNMELVGDGELGKLRAGKCIVTSLGR